MSLNSLKNFLTKAVFSIPVSVPFSGIVGYNVCGAKCAAIATSTNMADLALKYFNIMDSYYLTYSSIGVIFGHKLGTQWVHNYKAASTAPAECETLKVESSLSVIKIGYLDKVLSVSMGATGMIVGNLLHKIENTVVDYFKDEEITHTIELVQPQEVYEL
jgi:hypothetical protein